jgi:hypothetical protein
MDRPAADPGRAPRGLAGVTKRRLTHYARTGTARGSTRCRRRCRRLCAITTLQWPSISTRTSDAGSKRPSRVRVKAGPPPQAARPWGGASRSAANRGPIQHKLARRRQSRLGMSVGPRELLDVDSGDPANFGNGLVEALCRTTPLDLAVHSGPFFDLRGADAIGGRLRSARRLGTSHRSTTGYGAKLLRRVCTSRLDVSVNAPPS